MDNRKMKKAVILSAAAFYLLELSTNPVVGDCCYPVWRCGVEMEPDFGFWRGCCNDGLHPWSSSSNGSGVGYSGWIYCGSSACNFFGCGCECRKRPPNWVSLIPFYSSAE